MGKDIVSLERLSMEHAVERLCSVIHRKIELLECIKQKYPDTAYDHRDTVLILLFQCLGKYLLGDPKRTKSFLSAIANPHLDRDNILEYFNNSADKKIIETDLTQFSKDISGKLNQIIACINKQFIDNYFNSSDDDEKKAIFLAYFQKLGLDDELIKNALYAKSIGCYEDAVKLLEIINSILPDHTTAIQLLQEIYPKAIQNVIDEGRYEDAYELNKCAFEILPEFSINIQLAKSYYLMIKQTKLLIRKIWDFHNKSKKILIDGIKEGIGELSFINAEDSLGIARGHNNDETKITVIQQAYLQLEKTYLTLYVDGDDLVIQSDFSLDVNLTDENGRKIKSTEYVGEVIYSLTD